jgi:hypothetical protein
MPNLPKCQNKTKRRKKKQSESAKGPDIRFLYDLACCTVYMSTDLDTHIVYGLAVGIYCI